MHVDHIQDIQNLYGKYGALHADLGAIMLYHGPVTLNDFYEDIDLGFSAFLHAGYNPPAYWWNQSSFILHIAPQYYYNLPVVEIISYFLRKQKHITLSNMALTALHEAISNSLLWGLLKVERPHDIFEFHHVIQDELKVKESARQTLTIAVHTKPQLGVRLINPYDTHFDLEKFHTSPSSPYMRGSEIIRMFSQVDYDPTTHALNLMFGESDDVYKTIA